MAVLQLPFAKRILDGKLVSPDELPRGAACDCLCPGCGNPVIAKKGTEREWHFAHAKGEACYSGYEVSVHELAKQLLRAANLLLLPAFNVHATAHDAFGHRVHEMEPVCEEDVIPVLNAGSSRIVGDVTPDVTCDTGTCQYLVEVTVFHSLADHKRARIEATGLPSVHIDLSEFKVMQATRDRLEAALADPSKRHWIFHPDAEQARQRAQARLNTKLMEREVERIAREAARVEREETIVRREPEQLSRACTRLWRASFPTQDKIQSACRNLADRTGTHILRIYSVVDTVTRRSQLAAVTPEQLASQWAVELGLTEQDIWQFFREGGYLL